MPIVVERDDLISWIIIDRVEAGNSLDKPHLDELAAKIREECEEPSTRVVVVTGRGEKFFTTGVDLGATSRVRGLDDAWSLMYEGLGGVCLAMTGCRKPVIAAINGHAIGAGMELLNAVDLAVAVRWAKFSSPAVRWGMVPPGTPTLGPFLFGAKNAALVALTGRTFTAEDVLRMGFINMVVDSTEELRREVRKLAEDIAKGEPFAVEQTRRLLADSRLHFWVDRGLRALAESTARPVVAERASEFLKGKRVVEK
ncbi:MAG: enoyl-CoA hydratase/isomerase family protein [Desulfurococcales archaeon]|nr:enoyl-CoA hydratase/isomerase family protein [Desulfurococcales archaeon]